MKQAKIVLHDKNCMPYKKYQDDRGMDLKARLSKPIEIKPMQRITIPTGVSIQTPEGYVGDVRPRSGLAKDHGIVATYGTIDGYTGQIFVTLINLSTDIYEIQPYERIAQYVFVRSDNFELKIVDKLDETERGSHGFGSSGKF